MWPFEKRDYTETITTALLEAAATPTANASGIAAVRAVAGLLARSFAVAEVQGGKAATDALTVPVRARIADDLVRHGCSVWEIQVRQGKPTLIPVDQWERTGNIYRLWIGSQERIRPADAVMHVRWAGRSEPPWSGYTATLAAGLERGLSEEAASSTGYIVPLPGSQDLEKGPGSKLVDALKSLKGKRVTARTPGGGFGNPTERVQGGYQQQRLGIDPPEHLVALRRDVIGQIAACCGVPAVLLGGDVQGEALREAMRTALHTFIAPAAAFLEHEAALKLDDCKLDFSRLFAADTRARAQALKGMVEAGIELAEARRLCGLM